MNMDEMNMDEDRSSKGQIHASIRGNVSGQVGVGEDITQTQTRGAPAPTAQPDPAALRQALKDLYAALEQAALPVDAKIGAQTATGNALVQGVKDGEVNPHAIESHVREVANTLTQANVAVRQGSALWQSIEKMALLLGPLVIGGTHAVGTWFGIVL
jgi:hypothetical protein